MNRAFAAGAPGRLQAAWHSLYRGSFDMPTKTPITVAYGDGIGPEIMNATLPVSRWPKVNRVGQAILPAAAFQAAFRAMRDSSRSQGAG
jgi:hypothetical protein